MNHKRARKILFEYLNGTLKGKEKYDFESHISECKECRKELEELKNILSELKRKPTLSIDGKAFEKTRYVVYKALEERGISHERVSSFIVPLLLLCFITFIFFNFPFYNILLKFFGESTLFIFCAFLIYQFSGIIFFFVSLITKFRGGLENGKHIY